MRFAQAHKVTSYLTVASAFLALVSGGTVSPLVTLLGGLGLAGSWWWEAPRVRVERWTWLFTGLSLLALAWGVVLGVTTGDYLGQGAGFLVILTVARAFTRKAAKDWQQLYLLAFLMLVAGRSPTVRSPTPAATRRILTHPPTPPPTPPPTERRW